MKIFGSIIASALLIALTGCGSSDSDGTTPDTNTNTSTTTTGTFVDSAVSGLGYSCSSGATGLTNASGEFTCDTGDTITFDINGYVLGSSLVKSVISPADLTTDFDTIVNIAQLLQTLDGTGDLTDGIQINETLRANLQGATIALDGVDFDTDMASLLGVSLVTETTAMAHLNDTLGVVTLANAMFSGMTYTFIGADTMVIDFNADHTMNGAVGDWSVLENKLIMGATEVTFTSANTAVFVNANGTNEYTFTTAVTALPPVTIGMLLANQVEGMKYKCESTGVTGVTNEFGTFECTESGDITFYLEGFVFGTVPMQHPITPRTFFPDNDEYAINMMQLIQALDDDGYTDSRIAFSGTRTALLDGAVLDFTSPTFDADANALFADELTRKTIVSEADALAHYNNSMSQYDVGAFYIWGTAINNADLVAQGYTPMMMGNLIWQPATVEMLSPNDASILCQNNGGRIPTSAEFQQANDEGVAEFTVDANYMVLDGNYQDSTTGDIMIAYLGFIGSSISIDYTEADPSDSNLLANVTGYVELYTADVANNRCIQDVQ